MPNRGQRSVGAPLGVAAVVAGLAAAQLVSALKSGLNNPVVSLGNRVIDHVPAGAKKFAIQTFGVNDKTALVVSILIVVLVLAMLIGRTFIAGNVRRAFGAIVVMSAIAAAAALVDPGSTILSPLPLVIVGLVTILVLQWFRRRVSKTDEVSNAKAGYSIEYPYQEQSQRPTFELDDTIACVSMLAIASRSSALT